MAKILSQNLIFEQETRESNDAKNLNWTGFSGNLFLKALFHITFARWDGGKVAYHGIAAQVLFSSTEEQKGQL